MREDFKLEEDFKWKSDRVPGGGELGEGIKGDLKLIIRELAAACDRYQGQNDPEMMESIRNAHRIFVAGAGRSGYIMRCFAMRLVHLGFPAYVIGDTEMIAAGEGDLLIIGSGSGETKTLLVYAEKARQLNMKTLLFTCDKDSAIAQNAKFVCVINAQTKFQDHMGTQSASGKPVSLQPMGSLFEQMLLLLTDAVILGLARQMGVDFEQLKNRHSNLE